MIYPYLEQVPRPWISNPKIQTINSTRKDLLNLRDFLAFTGYLPGWNMSLFVNTGTELQPDGIRFVKGKEHLFMIITWVSRDPSLNGNGNNYPSKIAYFYREDGTAATEVPLTDKNGKYVVTYTYAADDTCTAATWGTS